MAWDTLRLAFRGDRRERPHRTLSRSLAGFERHTIVAGVDASGLVTGVGAGNVEITATYTDIVGRATLTVVAPATVVVLLEPNTVRFSALADTVRLGVKVREQIGRPPTDVRAYNWVCFRNRKTYLLLTLPGPPLTKGRSAPDLAA